VRVKNLNEARRKPRKISIFGNFGSDNFGNESTLQVILYYLHHYLPDAEVTSICSGPEAIARAYKIAAVPISGVIVKPWILHSQLAKLVRKVFIGIPSEVYRWLKAFQTLKGTDMLIVPGTGLLTDAFGISNWGWGPYGLFKWSLIAKLCRSKLLFVSVGAGPVYSPIGRWLIKSALSMADFRSYRDHSTKKYLKSIGFQSNNDQVYPDLVFSLPDALIPHSDIQKGRRRVVGLGLMEYGGTYGPKEISKATYEAYLKSLVIFVGWLLTHEYDVRLLIGDGSDRPVVQAFADLLKERLVRYDEGRIMNEPASSVDHLLSQLAATDVVVATRFHNVVFSLVLNRPVISISFHHKCASLMSDMGLSEYCQDINQLDADKLIRQFCHIEKNVEKLRCMIQQKTEVFCKALDQQYNAIFNKMWPE
jgi:polysaccharide pyruvyl transferase WcaK-like protein